jgi:bifunctional DNA-binding transcriptional regulator/antitoxin component of YhaV-PrlF toxin-antitoxin module
MIHSRITSKSQTTIPRAVREALGVGPGDRLGYVFRGKDIVLTSGNAAGDTASAPSAIPHDAAAARAALERLRRRARTVSPTNPITIEEILEWIAEGRR